MRTITIHISEETAEKLRTFHVAHRTALEGVTECRDTLVDLHPESCTDENCPSRRQIAAYDREIAVGESLQRLHHDIIESLQFTPIETE